MNTSIYGALQSGFTVPIRDALWGHVYFTPELAALTHSPPFTRLSRILQLGPAYCVYPGATHTRAAHSIGVYHLARRLLHSLAERGAEAWMSVEGARSFLCAALLHDAGHFPYAHSLKDLPLRSHESLTGSIILTEPLKTVVAQTGADPYLTAAIVDDGLPADKSELLFYRRLLSGALDPDKLDYLNRDARYCGVPYGAQDVDFIFSRLYPHKERGLAIDSRLIPCVEAILFSKYLMYKAVYWHRSVRSATALIKRAIVTGLEKGLMTPETLYDLDDQGLSALLTRYADTVGTGAEQIKNGQLYSLVAEFPSPYNEQAVLNNYPSDTFIIDIPEPVSFETKLYVRDEECFFEESSSVFSRETVAAFQNSLQTIRVFAPPSSSTL